MGISIEGDVSHGVPFAHEVLPATEMLLHELEGLVTALMLLWQPRQLIVAPIYHDGASRGHVRLMAVLLPEQPLQHLRSRPTFHGQIFRALGEIAEYGVGLGQVFTVVGLEQRHLAVGIARQELGSAGLPAGGIHLHPAIGLAQLREHELHLVAVSGVAFAIDGVHLQGPPADFDAAGGVKFTVTVACCVWVGALLSCASKYHCCNATTAAVSNTPGGTAFTTFTLLGTPPASRSKASVTLPLTGAARPSG